MTPQELIDLISSDITVRQWIQREVLRETTSGNPQLPASPPAQRHTLKTNNQSVNRAVNEVFDSADGSAQAVISFGNRFDNVVGDNTYTESANFDYINQNIGDNLIQAVVELHTDMQSVGNEWNNFSK